jgi:superfamily II DNA helicase RecQ
MHSYADRYTHDFFFERDYPDVAVLDGILAQLRSEPQEKTVLQKRLRMKPDIFDKALEKLWIHGGAVMDFAENVSCGQPQWRKSYIAHGKQKRAQIDLVIRYAESNQCRMSTLVRHFGDLADGQTACGICDFCAPAQCVAQRFRTATEAERTALFSVIAALRAGDTKSTGKLHGELCPNGVMSRDAFEEVLGAMARAGLVRLSDAVFEKDGKQIPYRKVSLTRLADAVDQQTPFAITIKDLVPSSATSKGKKRTAPGTKRPDKIVRQKPVSSAQHAESDSRIEVALRQWRMAEARRRGVPAFRIFNEQALKAMASRRPRTARELLAISGIGTTTVEKYGQQIYRIVKDNGGW